jgi:hypothetical protein
VICTARGIGQAIDAGLAERGATVVIDDLCVAILIKFLASGRAANITGADYLIDGGLIKTT